MLRRWLIRMPFLLALALVVGLWVGSYLGDIIIRRLGKEEVRMLILDGRVGFDAIPFDALKTKWTFYCVPIGALNWTDADSKTRFHLFGFCFNPVADDFCAVFPLWFPTLLLLALNWFVWRKTRPIPVDRAFPVEPQKQEAETK